MTDYIVAGTLLLFFLNGWRKGLIKSVVGPISLIIGGIAGWIYYQQDGNMLVALGISILGPFILNIILSFLIGMMNFAKGDAPPFSIGRILGAFFSAAWVGAMTGLTLILIGLIPGNFEMLNKVRNDVLSSRSYAFAQNISGGNLPTSADLTKVAEIFNDPDKIQKLSTSKEFKDIQNDTKVRDLIQDEELLEQIQNKDYASLITNPKMQAIMQDEELIKKFLSLHQKVLSDEGALVEADVPSEETAEKKKGKWFVNY